MPFSGAALATKAKSMYGQMLKKSDYDELIHKRSVAEIAAYLKNETVYARVLSDVREGSIHRGELENLIQREGYSRSLKLIHFCEIKLKKYYQLYLDKIAITLLLGKVRDLISDNYERAIAEFPMYLQNQMKINLHKLLLARSYDEMLDVVKETRFYNVLHAHRVKKGNEYDIQYTQLEFDLWNDYYKYTMRVVDKQISGHTKTAIKALIKTELELKNIIKIYRYKAFFNESDEYIKKTLYMDTNRMPSDFIDELVSQPNADGILRTLANSKYHSFQDENKNTYIEYFADRIQYSLAQQQIHFSQVAPIVFTSFANIQSNELENIINIIEGVRYQVEPEEIEKLLIY